MVASPSAAPASWQEEAATTVRRRGSGRKPRPRPQTRRPGDQPSAETEPPLLATKITAPARPFRVVSRPRLLALLDDGAQQLLTLVSAPAGAGKTTLLAAWSSEGRRPGPAAWVSLDSGDNQPARFWAYALAALCGSGAVPANSALRSLAPRPGSETTFLPLLVRGLAELPTPVVLILDDVQELTDARVLQELEFLLRHAPPQLRLVLATRVDPPLPLQRLRISGQLAQLRAADLAFTTAEVADLLAGCDHQPRLSEDDLALLQARTEGWAAGVRLAALSLQDQPDPHRFVTEFAGDDQSIADYLVGEVLDRQPEELRSFLLRTCIVEELDGDLADALTGGHNGEWTLARLARANAFVQALGSRGRSYRYHQLFAGLLRCELRRKAPGQVAELHRRAAHWYAARGLVIDAIEQALAAGDGRDAADMMVENGLSLILRGEAATLENLAGRLPAELVQSDPELALLAASDRIMSADHETASTHLRLALQREGLLHQDRRGRFVVLLAVLRSAVAWPVGDVNEVLAAGHEALAVQAPAGACGGDGDGRAVTLSNLGAAELWAGDLDAAEVHLRDGQAVALRAGLGSLQLSCTSQLAVLHVMRGALGQALRLGTNAVELATQHGRSSSVQAAGGHLALAWVHYQRDDLVEAGRHLDQATASSEVDLHPVRLAVAIPQARLQRARGDMAGALATLASARRSLTGWRPPARLWRWLILTEAELHSAGGSSQLARELLETLDQRVPLDAGEAAVLARMQLAEEDPTGAAATLASCLDGAAPSDRMAPVEAWLVDALASDLLADRDRAAASLERALTLAEREGFRRSFLDAGAPARSLLARYRHRVPSCWSYLDELLQASAESAPMATSPPVLIEQLTERERTVLRYLPSLMTYEEIASDLYVSVNTVKSHVYGVFRKLGVSGRRQAVRSARELRLL
jgi:LuxR family transcriptional regulator, maltose regulon positive regulatory protein